MWTQRHMFKVLGRTFSAAWGEAAWKRIRMTNVSNLMIMTALLALVQAGCGPVTGVGTGANYNAPAASVEDRSSGLTKIVSEPQVPATRARAICEPQARAAASRAVAGFTPSNTGYRATCSETYLGSYDCRGSSYTSGGFAGGLMAGLEERELARETAKAVYLSCLSGFGWTKEY